MQSRAAGRGVNLTPLGIGGAQLGNLGRITTEDECAETFAAAWAGGARYFDTAPHYGLGLSERRLGALLAAQPRDEFVLSTKVGRLLEPTPERADVRDDDGFAVPAEYRRAWDFSRDGILRSIDESLSRLGMDFIDIAYLHDPDDHWGEASTSGVDALIELRDQGVVRAIGAGMNQSAMLAEFVRQCDVDVMMVAGRLTLLDRSAMHDLVPAAQERGVALVVAGVYNTGLLSQPVVPQAAQFDYHAAPPELVERARAMARVCDAHGVTLPDAAIQFALRLPQVASVVVGVRGTGQVRDAFARVESEIPNELWGELDALAGGPARA